MVYVSTNGTDPIRGSDDLDVIGRNSKSGVHFSFELVNSIGHSAGIVFGEYSIQESRDYTVYQSAFVGSRKNKKHPDCLSGRLV